MTLADIVKKRVMLRDEIARIKRIHTEELAPAYEACAALDSMMLDYFSRESCKRLVTDSGTAHRRTIHTVKMANRQEFREFALVNDWAADIKPNKGEAVKYLDTKKENMPGVEIDGSFAVGYRRVGEPDEGEEI